MKVLIVDDHPVVRSGLRRLLETVPEIEAIEAADAQRALDVFRRERPDVVVVDINLPDMSGLELLRKLIAEDPAVRVVIFSMHAELLYATQALKAGALGYVSKIAPPGEIFEAIRKVAEGGTYLEHQLAQELALSRISKPRTGTDASMLTDRETELLRLLAAGNSLTEMADATGVSYKTVANTMSLLKSRLGVSTTAELVRIAIKSGIAV